MEQAILIQEAQVHQSETLSSAILHVLAYFDVFEYPLTAREIHEYASEPGIEYYDLKFELDRQVSLNLIHKTGNYYHLGHASCIARREAANQYSDKLFRQSEKYSRLIGRFPFVRGVMISGSLSKNNAQEDADVDYFIITEKNRLWICRSLLTLYKKIFLLNSRKYFCINYFVDTENLAIREKNIFTATEIAFLVPVYSGVTFFRFLSANTWVSDFYPSKKVEIKTSSSLENAPWIKRTAERVYNTFLGNAFDDMLMKGTRAYRKIKFSRMSDENFNVNMRAMKGVSKHHPHSFQKKVLKAYHDKLEEISLKSGITL